MGILGVDFVVTQSAEETNNSVRHPLASFGKIVVFREISIRKNIQSATGANKLSAFAKLSQIFWVLSRTVDFKGKILAEAVEKTFNKRGSSGFLMGLYKILWFVTGQQSGFSMSGDDELCGFLRIPTIHHP